MLIDDQMVCLSQLSYYDPGFRQVLEDHLTFIKSLESTQVEAISPESAWHYKGDFFRLLRDMNIPSHLHWYIMRMCGYHSPDEAGEELSEIYIPNQEQLEQMRNNHSTTHTFALSS